MKKRYFHQKVIILSSRTILYKQIVLEYNRAQDAKAQAKKTKKAKGPCAQPYEPF